MIEAIRKTGATWVTLNRPEKHNALTPTMIIELTNLFHQLGQESETRLIVLAGKGKSFCAGADLGAMQAVATFTFAENVADGEAIFDLMWAVDSCPKPVIGRVQGVAIGGGAGLVSCCDIVVAAKGAKFGFTEARLGIVPATISPFVLSKIPPTYARPLFLTGEIFTAQHAHQIGLIHHLAEDEIELDQTIDERVITLLQAAPEAQAVAKKLIRQVTHQSKENHRQLTSQLIAERRASPEGQEGMSAFLEKRQPYWRR